MKWRKLGNDYLIGGNEEMGPSGMVIRRLNRGVRSWCGQAWKRGSASPDFRCDVATAGEAKRLVSSYLIAAEKVSERT